MDYELLIIGIIVVAIVILLLFFNPFQSLGNTIGSLVSSAGNSIDSGLGGTKDDKWCPKDDPNKQCLRSCPIWSLVEPGQDYYCWKDYGDNWKSSGQIGQGSCTVGSGTAICEKDDNINRRYMKNCIAWNDIDLNGNKFCHDDHGDGWVYNGEKGQYDCTPGFGRGKCVYDENQKGKQYMNNCVAWNDIDPNGNVFCNNDHGDGWVYTGEKEQAGCTPGFGKGKCRYDETQKGKKYMNNCIMWNQIESDGNKFCNNDFGAGYVYTGEREQAGCSPGFGKGKCHYDDSERNKQKIWKNCVTWNEIPAFGDRYCKDDFGNSYTYQDRGQYGCAWGWGKGVCNSN